MKICIVLGTRPEIIKLAPIIKYCADKRIEHFIVHTNQHYSESLDGIFFQELGLEKPKYNLNVGSGAIAYLEESTHGKQTAMMLERIERVLIKEKPNIVIAHGDTNSSLAAALAASKLRIPLAHVEAGLRSYDRDMPEETNRVIFDHVADYLFAPTEEEAAILKGEGIPPNRIFTVGNTVVDALTANISRAEKSCHMLEQLGLKDKGYILATAHRPKNVDTKAPLSNILSALGDLRRKYGIPVIYPAHPRSKKMIASFGLKPPDGVRIIDAVGYLEFLQLLSHCRLVLTDSGGVQEEACILRIPCVTLRENTERPETINVGANALAGTDRKKIVSAAAAMLSKSPDWDNPFGDGRAGARIMEILVRRPR